MLTFLTIITNHFLYSLIRISDSLMTPHQCFLIGLSFLIGLVPIRTIRTMNRPLIGLIVHIIVQHIAGLYKYISYMYGIYIIYHILYIYIVDIEHISS